MIIRYWSIYFHIKKINLCACDRLLLLTNTGTGGFLFQLGTKKSLTTAYHYSVLMIVKLKHDVPGHRNTWHIQGTCKSFSNQESSESRNTLIQNGQIPETPQNQNTQHTVTYQDQNSLDLYTTETPLVKFLPKWSPTKYKIQATWRIEINQYSAATK